MARATTRRASPGYTYEVCPGCNGERQDRATRTENGVTTELPSPRKKDEVCRGCQKMLADAERIVALDAAAKARKAEQVEHRGTEVVVSLRDDLRLHDEQRGMQRAFAALAKATGVPVPKGHSEFIIPIVAYEHVQKAWDKNPGGYGIGHTGPQALFTPAQIAAFGDTVRAVEAAIERAYQRGHEDGADLLRRLAAGDSTVFEYDAQRSRREEA